MPLRHKDLMDIAKIAKSMDIEPLTVDQSLCGHQINMQGGTTMHTFTIRITIPGKVVTTIKSMVIYARIILEHISRGIIKDG